MPVITARIRLRLFSGLICKMWRKIMIYELAKPEDVQAVYDVVQNTIKTIYPKYYPSEVVDFFCELHSRETIAKDIENGYGTFIMKNIEAQISDKYDKAYLEASLPASALYEKLGFSIIKHESCLVENGVILAYEVMEKRNKSNKK